MLARAALRSSATPMSALFLGVLLCGALGACRDPGPPPNLILFTVDTLRADHLGAYGSTATRTPHLDRLADEGTVFENAAAPIPVTRPSHFTMLTSRYPREHGVTDNHLALPEEELTLPEVLRDAGYRTGAFTAIGLLGRHSGAEQGFDTFDPPERGEGRRTAEEVVAQATAWLRTLRAGEPFFLWVHVFDPHMPYSPPEFFRPPGPGLDAVGWPELQRLGREAGGHLGAEIYDRTVALYAGEVEAVDAAFGLLDLELQERGLGGRAVTVFTADHGECFENGFFFRHAGCLYDGAIRVPLVIRYPGRVAAGRRVAAPVEHVDLAPTLLALAGVERPAPFVGRALYRRGGAAVSLPDEHYALIQHSLPRPEGFRRRRRLWSHIETVRGEPMRRMVDSTEQVGLRSVRWKYLVTRGRAEELYDLADDPGETRDVAAEQRRVVQELRAFLRRELDEHPLKVLDAGELDPALREQLEALGYL